MRTGLRKIDNTTKGLYNASTKSILNKHDETLQSINQQNTTITKSSCEDNLQPIRISPKITISTTIQDS